MSRARQQVVDLLDHDGEDADSELDDCFFLSSDDEVEVELKEDTILQGSPQKKFSEWY